MSYLTHPTQHGSTLINLDSIRRVDVIRANPAGGGPCRDNGRITYEDGTVMEVTMGCALAVQNAFKSKTVPTFKDGS
jgi:hypothetical protein